MTVRIVFLLLCAIESWPDNGRPTPHSPNRSAALRFPSVANCFMYSRNKFSVILVYDDGVFDKLLLKVLFLPRVIFRSPD